MAVKFIIKRQTDAPDAVPLAEQTFDGTIATIGSGPGATIYLNDTGVASEQAVIISEENQLLLINRADGTALNGQTLRREERHTLTDGDRLRVGAYVIQLVFNHATASPPPQRTPSRSAENTTRQSPVITQTASQDATPATPPANGDPPRKKSFAAILDRMRTEEDSFYFLIGGQAHSQQRVPIDKPEMLLGWDETGKNISCEAAHVVAPRAVVRKDWSGVIVQAESADTIAVNGEPIESPRRLRNGDRLTLLPTALVADINDQFLIFHEPESLVVLDSVLPQQLPPPVAVEKAPEQSPPSAGTTLPARMSVEARSPKSNRKYFGHFTLLELLVMACGTLLAAVIVFLILEYI